MGLDSYFTHHKVVEEDADPDEHKLNPTKDVQLVGGLFSGDGNNGSFRGKVYNDFVQHVTGESLYQHSIPPQRVREMARALKRYEWTDEDETDDAPWKELATYGGTPAPRDEDEYDSLVKVFMHFSAQNAYLEGWW